MKIKLKPFNLKEATPNKTAIRVYCMHGHWDGVFLDHTLAATSNQPNKKQLMIRVGKEGVFGVMSYLQHPKQCRIIESVVDWSSAWWICDNSTHRPVVGPFSEQAEAVNYVLAQDEGFASHYYTKQFHSNGNLAKIGAQVHIAWNVKSNCPVSGQEPYTKKKNLLTDIKSGKFGPPEHYEAKSFLEGVWVSDPSSRK